MQRLLVGLCTAMLLGVCLLVGAGVSEAAPAKVSYEVDNIILDNDYVVLKGHFHNNTDYFQRVTGMEVTYLLRGGLTDDEQEHGYPMFNGSYSNDDMHVDIGGDDVPYDIRVQDAQAKYYKTENISGWKVKANLDTE
jgi:hypothetical protein